MPKIKFTKAIIDKLPPPVGASDTYFAEGMPGLGLRVGKTKKTFFVQKDIIGRACTYTIGKYDPWTVELASKEARELLVMMAKGIDPNESKRQQKAKAIWQLSIIV